MLHSFLSERKWGYYVKMHDNKEKEWREHSFLTPTLLHHTPIATLCHPTPSFLPVLFLVYWIFLFSRPGNKTSLFVLWALFSMFLIQISMNKCKTFLTWYWPSLYLVLWNVCFIAIQMFSISWCIYSSLLYPGVCFFPPLHCHSQWSDSLGKNSFPPTKWSTQLAEL